MKKIILLLALIFLNSQVASAIQETTDSFMAAPPSFDKMNKQLNQQYFIPAKTEAELDAEKEQKLEEARYEKSMTEEFDRGFYHSKGNSIKPIQLLRLKVKKALIDRRAKKEAKKNGTTLSEEARQSA